MSFFSKFLKTETNIKSVSALALQQLIENKECPQLLDVRTSREFKQQRIAKALNIDVFSADFEHKCQAKFDLSQPILLYCQSGQRSMNAARKLEKIGFKEIYNLKGGMIAWSRV